MKEYNNIKRVVASAIILSTIFVLGGQENTQAPLPVPPPPQTTLQEQVTPTPAPEVVPATPVQVPSRTQQRPDALLLYNTGRYAEAILACEQEIRDNPGNVESYVVMCWSLVKNGQNAEAENWASRARDLSPFDHRVVEILGESKYFLGKNEEALALFEEYVSLVGENGGRIGEVYYFMGEIYVRLEKYNHADISFSKAIRTEPLLDHWWTRLGYAREMAQNYDLSLQAYDQALVLNPSQDDARRGRNRVLELL